MKQKENNLKKTFSFHECLYKGQIGEGLFASLFPELERLNGVKSDYRHRVTGELYEIKTDSYDATKTANFFIERYRNDNNMTNGGPWQSKDHGSTKFVYFFPVNKLAYIFEVGALIEALEKIIPTLKPKYIKNKGYNTIGFAVPRELLKHISTEIRFNV